MMMKTMRMPWTKTRSSILDPSLIWVVLTASGLNLSLHQHPCRLLTNPTLSPLGPKRARSIYGTSDLSSSPSTYLVSPTTKIAQTLPCSPSHPTVSPRVSPWIGLLLLPLIHPLSGCSLGTSIPRFTLPQPVKLDLMPCHNPSQLTHLPWKTCNGALPNHRSSLPVQPINLSRFGTSG